MRIAAALAWWDERPEDLYDCVRGIGKVADVVVAVDGAYRRYPGATPKSPDEQVEAIREAAREVGIECVIHQTDRLWAGQLEKRSFLVGEAVKGSDWIIILDTDHIISTDRDLVRQEVGAIPAGVDIAYVDFFTPDKPGAQAATNWHGGMVGTTMKLAHFFRSYPGMKAEKRHWNYTAVKNGTSIRLDYDVSYGAADYHVKTPYVVEHRTLFRDEAHMLANRAFCNDRIMVVERTGQEDDQPGLPEPVWDYETIPY